MSDNVENIILQTGKGKNVDGNSSTNTIKGNAYANILTGGNHGNDSIYGYGGNDHLYGSIDSCYLDGGADDDYLTTALYSSAAGDDTLIGGTGVDTMKGGAGDDYYSVDEQDDVVIESASQGNDTVKSSATIYYLTDNVENLIMTGSAETGYGNSLDNYIEGSSTSDNFIVGNGGNDTIYGKGGDNTIVAGTGNDLIYADDGSQTGTGNNDISTFAGDDTIYGAAGADTIDAGAGDDIILGGAGNDLYQFSSGDGIDAIADTAGTDTISFDSSVTRSNIAVYIDSSGDLQIDYGSTSGNDQIGVVNQTTDTIESITTSDGYYLSNTTIDQLVQDLTSYATENSINLSSVEDVKADSGLMALVNSAWQAA